MRETAKYLKCKVCVGYPELQLPRIHPGDDETKVKSDPAVAREKYYNSLLVVGEDGEIIFNYRKRFLYYTDDTWASEGDINGFNPLTFKSKSPSSIDINKVPTSFGICMDINPYKFEAPYSAWEFANKVLDTQSQLVILSMAWLTAGPKSDFEGLGTGKPDMDTFNYWIGRFWPLLDRQSTENGNHMNQALIADPDPETSEFVLVFANRSGEEGGDGCTSTAVYAGTSTIITLKRTRSTDAANPSSAPNCQILCWDMKDAMEEGICFADTSGSPKMVFNLVSKT